MKLFAISKFSPFASRPRLAVEACNLPVEVVATPGDGGPHHADYLAINPLGKIPALLLDDGTVIVESDSIVEYFADRFPEARLRPDGIEAMARCRMLGRIAELYVMESFARIFSLFDPKTRSWSVSGMDPAVLEQIFTAVDRRLGHLEHFMGEDAFAMGDRFSTADCALVPVLTFIGALAVKLDRGGWLDGHPKVAGYWRRVQAHPAVANMVAEMTAAVEDRVRP
jgi:glutathione S-transferase